MKTIQQQIKLNLAKKYFAKSNNPKKDIDRKTDYETGFYDGVEFTQRWISIKDELPPIDKLVQVKIQEIDSDKVYYDHDKIMPQEPFNMFECEQSMVTVTHWRPIELE